MFLHVLTFQFPSLFSRKCFTNKKVVILESILLRFVLLLKIEILIGFENGSAIIGYIDYF